MIAFLARIAGWFADPAHWQGSDGVPMRLFEHVWYSLFAVLAAVAIALPIGLLVGHTNRGGEIAVNIASLGRAIPSFGLLVLAFALAGFGYGPVWVVLTVLAFPSIVTNSFIGIRSVDPEVRESASAMGMTGWQVLSKVEVPIAVPLIMAGIRTAAVQIVATTTLAAFIAEGGLGRYIFDGLPQGRYEEVVAGALLVAALALLTEFGLGRLQRAIVPHGLRRQAESAALDAKIAMDRSLSVDSARLVGRAGQGGRGGG
jgi:osmoprotectant transport system permease protein